jgi:hypothetical protein
MRPHPSRIRGRIRIPHPKNHPAKTVPNDALSIQFFVIAH